MRRSGAQRHAPRSSDAGQGNASDEIIKGVASILQEASIALARLGAQAADDLVPSSIPKPSADGGASASLAGAAEALAQVAAQFQQPTGCGGAVPSTAPGFRRGASHPPKAAALIYDTHAEESVAEEWGEAEVLDGAEDVAYAYPGDELGSDGADAQMSTADFLLMNQLEQWVGEALDLLTPPQRAAVMNPAMNVGNARNVNGIVVSRIKQAVPLDQRLGIFVQINGLSQGVVDRIGTLTPEQAESVMESGLKIQKASNPSAVAMKRISDVLRNNKSIGDNWGSSRDAHSSRERSRTPAPRSIGSGDTPDDIGSFVSSLGLEWWCGEVLKRLSLWQRQQITKDVQHMPGVRNPSGVVMSRVRQIVDTSELLSIFIDINGLDSQSQAQLWALNPNQQAAVMSPGIFLQNVRNPSTAVLSRINNVMAGNDAFGKPRNDVDLQEGGKMSAANPSASSR